MLYIIISQQNPRCQINLVDFLRKHKNDPPSASAAAIYLQEPSFLQKYSLKYLWNYFH